MDWPIIVLFFTVPLIVGLLVKRYGRSKDVVNILLSFSGAFLLSVAVLHVLPELYAQGGASIGKWLLAGFVLQVVLEFFSKGIEHGHAHLHGRGSFPWVVLASLCVHSLLEGVPFAGVDDLGIPMHDAHGHEGHAHESELVGLPLLLGVLLHKLPVTVALVSVIISSKASNSKLVIYLLLFAISFPAGVLLGGQLAPMFGDLNKALALAMGMLLHISMTIIFESSSDHKFNPRRFIAVVAGIAGAFLTLV
jgi:zinc transporter ZupT